MYGPQARVKSPGLLRGPAVPPVYVLDMERYCETIRQVRCMSHALCKHDVSFRQLLLLSWRIPAACEAAALRRVCGRSARRRRSPAARSLGRT